MKNKRIIESASIKIILALMIIILGSLSILTAKAEVINEANFASGATAENMPLEAEKEDYYIADIRFTNGQGWYDERTKTYDSDQCGVIEIIGNVSNPKKVVEEELSKIEFGFSKADVGVITDIHCNYVEDKTTLACYTSDLSNHHYGSFWFRTSNKVGHWAYLTITASNGMVAKYRKFGDIDNDDKITSADSLLILRQSVKLEDFEELQCTLSDVDDDGIISSADALEVLRYSVQLETESRAGAGFF